MYTILAVLAESVSDVPDRCESKREHVIMKRHDVPQRCLIVLLSKVRNTIIVLSLTVLSVEESSKIKT